MEIGSVLRQITSLAFSPSFGSDLLAPATTTAAAPFSPAAESPHLGFHFDAADTSKHGSAKINEHFRPDIFNHREKQIFRSFAVEDLNRFTSPSLDFKWVKKEGWKKGSGDIDPSLNRGWN